MKNVGIIGCGHIAKTMLASMVKVYPSSYFYGFDLDEEKVDRFEKLYSINKSPSVDHLMENSDIIFIAVKPKSLDGLLKVLKIEYNGQIIVSPIAGRDISEIIEVLPNAKVARIMPNVAAEIARSITALKIHNLDKIEEDEIKKLITSFGSIVEIEESQFETFIPLAGSSPAFFYLFLQSMVKFGVEQGYCEEEARLIAAKTMSASAELLLATNQTEDYMMKSIATPGGTTEAGLQSLIKNEFSTIVEQCLETTKNHSKKLK